MDYDTDDTTYIDSATGILKNKFNFTSQEGLDEAEAYLTTAHIAHIDSIALPKVMDLNYLKYIHKGIFEELYDWAGEIRTIRISKGKSVFAYPEHIESYAYDVFTQLASENYLKGLPFDQFIKRLAHYYSEINILHPFREGNGRTQRAFFSILARKNGYFINWSRMDQDENIRASVHATTYDESLLINFLKPLLEEIDSTLSS